jgi:hypothetical protein
MLDKTRPRRHTPNAPHFPTRGLWILGIIKTQKTSNTVNIFWLSLETVVLSFKRKSQIKTILQATLGTCKLCRMQNATPFYLLTPFDHADPQNVGEVITTRNTDQYMLLWKEAFIHTVVCV